MNGYMDVLHNEQLFKKLVKLLKIKDNNFLCIDGCYAFTIDQNSIRYIMSNELNNLGLFNRIYSVSYLKQIEYKVDDYLDYFKENNEVNMNICEIKNNILKQSLFTKWYNFKPHICLVKNGEYVCNIQDIQSFKDILSMKATQGAKPFFVNDIMITLYKGLLPVNKSDIVNLRYVKFQNNINLLQFEIIKSKNNNDNIYVNVYTLNV